MVGRHHHGELRRHGLPIQHDAVGNVECRGHLGGRSGAADFNGDGKTDITGRALQLGEWWTSLSTGINFSTTKWTTWSPNVIWSSISAGDFNGDGKADLIGREGNNLWVSLSTGAAFGVDLGASGIPADLTDIFGTSDFTGDGRADVVGEVARPEDVGQIGRDAAGAEVDAEGGAGGEADPQVVALAADEVGFAVPSTRGR